MYQSLALFQTANDMARHAGAQQAVTARNIANADTPGYVAGKIASFSEIYRENPAPLMRATRKGHVSISAFEKNTREKAATSEPAPNGNAVSLEEEMLNAVEIARSHNRAITIYRHTMTVLRTSLGR